MPTTVLAFDLVFTAKDCACTTGGSFTFVRFTLTAADADFAGVPLSVTVTVRLKIGVDS